MWTCPFRAIYVPKYFQHAATSSVILWIPIEMFKANQLKSYQDLYTNRQDCGWNLSWSKHRKLQVHLLNVSFVVMVSGNPPTFIWWERRLESSLIKASPNMIWTYLNGIWSYLTTLWHNLAKINIFLIFLRNEVIIEICLSSILSKIYSSGQRNEKYRP